VATTVLLSLLFSAEAGGAGSRIVLMAAFVALAAAAGLAVTGAGRSMRLSAALVRLQDTTAQIRVRGAFLLLAAFVVLADSFGVETILGAFIAGALLKLADRDRAMTHTGFHAKLEAVGFGVFVPFFFVASGLTFDLDALFASGSALAKVPIFLAALLAVRGLPALLYRSLLGTGRSAAAGLLQATSLGFLVVGSRLGIELELISSATGAALVTAGLLSVLVFPLAALALLARAPVPEGPQQPLLEPGR
jgi:Kef-type K+ transport system membrane component KefB